MEWRVATVEAFPWQKGRSAMKTGAGRIPSAAMILSNWRADTDFTGEGSMRVALPGDAMRKGLTRRHGSACA